MNCRKCPYESETEFDICPKCGSKQVLMYGQYEKEVETTSNQVFDSLKGSGIGLVLGVFINIILGAFWMLIFVAYDTLNYHDASLNELPLIIGHFLVRFTVLGLIVFAFIKMGFRKHTFYSASTLYVVITIIYFMRMYQ